MHYSTKSIFCIAFLATLLMVISCNKDPNPDCGCEGSAIEVIKNEPANYRGNGRFIVFSQDEKNLKFAVACKTDSTWETALNSDSANYFISGKYKRRCAAPEDAYSSSRPAWPFEITDIRKK